MENAAQPSYYEKTLNELLDKIRALDNDIPYTKLEDFEILLAICKINGLYDFCRLTAVCFFVSGADAESSLF